MDGCFSLKKEGRNGRCACSGLFEETCDRPSCAGVGKTRDGSCFAGTRPGFIRSQRLLIGCEYAHRFSEGEAFYLDEKVDGVARFAGVRGSPEVLLQDDFASWVKDFAISGAGVV